MAAEHLRHLHTFSEPVDYSLETAKKQAIIRALKAAKGNKRQAARMLKIGKTTLHRKLKEYDIEDVEQYR